jgi:hypothetical protein
MGATCYRSSPGNLRPAFNGKLKTLDEPDAPVAIDERVWRRSVECGECEVGVAGGRRKLEN